MKHIFKHDIEIEITLFSSPFDFTAIDLLDSLDLPLALAHGFTFIALR